jgi:hypothetical protein
MLLGDVDRVNRAGTRIGKEKDPVRCEVHHPGRLQLDGCDAEAVRRGRRRGFGDGRSDGRRVVRSARGNERHANRGNAKDEQRSLRDQAHEHLQSEFVPNARSHRDRVNAARTILTNL